MLPLSNALLTLIPALATALFLAFRLARSTRGPMDHPNARSLHQQPIPRTGGLAVLGGLVAGSFGLGCAVAGFPALLKPLLFGLLPLVIVSWLDDRGSIPVRSRLMVHGLAAGVLIAVGWRIPGMDGLPDWIVISLTGLFVMWMINLYNFMDGMDGFAGGMAVIGFGTLAWLGRADAEFTALSLMIAAASAGFLVCNFPPARIFLGDTGSTTLGFLAAALSLWGSQNGLFPFWAAVWVFSPFIVDATVTLLRRLARGERVWEAHRSHYYQRLVLLGWGHRRTVLVEYALMLVCAGSAMLAVQMQWPAHGLLALGGGSIYGGLMWGVARLERRKAVLETGKPIPGAESR